MDDLTICLASFIAGALTWATAGEWAVRTLARHLAASRRRMHR